MAGNSHIEWTDATWNPVTGCSKISPGCKNCYAERMAKRLKAMGQPNYANGFRVTLHPHMLHLPLTWRKPRRVFVNSMSDLFHDDVPVEFIRQVFAVMTEANWHQYQLLTKRPARALELDRHLNWQPNIWFGVSVENADYVHRIEDLRRSRAHVRFLSLEPLLGPLPNLNLHGIDWVIVGGESGPGARPMHSDWVRQIRDQCLEAGVPFFFKQWGEWLPGDQIGADGDKPTPAITGREWGVLDAGGRYFRNATRWMTGPGVYSDDGEIYVYRVGKRSAGRLLDGRLWGQMPPGDARAR